MRYFLDTEFIEDGSTIDLISIALVAEDGRQFYRQNTECNFLAANDWVWRNVFPHLQHFHMSGRRACSQDETTVYSVPIKASTCGPECPWRKRVEIRDEVRAFLDIEKHGKPEIWAYYADYDWVAFCQLFGTMVTLPKGFPMYCRDLKQLCVDVGDPDLPAIVGEHGALNDALWNQKVYQFLTSLPKAA